MYDTKRLPDIQRLVEPLIGLPYEHFQLPSPSGASNACYGLVHHLLKAGFGVDLATDAVHAAARFAEVWARGDRRDPWEVLQPWDGLVFITRGLVSDHVGIIVEPTTMVHVRRRTGVCVEPIRRWKPKLLQIVRLRMAW